MSDQLKSKKQLYDYESKVFHVKHTSLMNCSTWNKKSSAELICG